MIAGKKLRLVKFVLILALKNGRSLCKSLNGLRRHRTCVIDERIKRQVGVKVNISNAVDFGTEFAASASGAAYK